MISVRLQKAMRSHYESRSRPSNLPRIVKRIYLGVAVFLGLLLTGTAGFVHLGHPHSSWSDALFMTLITVTTVGYGEAVPLNTPALRFFAGGTAVIGFGTLTFLFTSLTMFFFESDIDDRLRRNRMQRTINQLRQHYIICGFGRVGHNVARELHVTQRKFVAIDEQADTLRQDQDSWKAPTLHGDASDDDLLILANIEHAEGVFAVTGDDSRNLMIALSAKQLNPEIRVVARCHDVRNIPKLQKAGADSIVSPDFTGGMRIASAMIRPHVVSFLDEMLRTDDGLRVEEIAVEHVFQGARLDQLGLRGKDYIIVAVRNGKQTLFNPANDFFLRAPHILIALVTPSGRHELKQVLQSHTQPL